LVAYANPFRAFSPATAAMTDDPIPLFSFPAVEGKKVTAAFDGGRMSSDGGVMLLSLAERSSSFTMPGGLSGGRGCSRSGR
jgi:hypothetical protein